MTPNTEGEKSEKTPMKMAKHNTSNMQDEMNNAFSKYVKYGRNAKFRKFYSHI